MLTRHNVHTRIEIFDRHACTYEEQSVKSRRQCKPSTKIWNIPIPRVSQKHIFCECLHFMLLIPELAIKFLV